MKRIVILGAGTAGTITANKLAQELDLSEWKITIVDQSELHYYQPGFLFIPFGIYGRNDVVRARRDYLPRDVELIVSEIELIEADKNQVKIKKDGRILSYDFLVIATGSRVVPEETPGLAEHEWRRSIFDFYTVDGALALQKYLRTWQGGRVVLNVAEMPIKCPVAPLEFLFLADWFFHEHGIRDRVELTLATPLPGAFTKPRASRLLGDMLDEKGISVVPEFNIMEVDPDGKKISSYDGVEIDYDLLISVPVNMGDTLIGRSGLGDELNFVPTEKHTLKARDFDNIFVLGDATNLPSSKAGSVAHFQGDVFIENFMRYVDGLPLQETFDGHANCYIESGFGKGFLIDFNYDVEPLPGKFPLPGVGPFSLLQESRMNHWGKMLFRWMYWNLLLKGKPLPITAQLQMAGKWN
ncbi:MAG: NAD(P)/FAD-dependent oxidoreductase [Anaerolineae bacterium]|nr:NAD(P)/FAD-dependent oxidoreductase [Anaerolineae bacterium]MCB9130970.1 NAD(P)/FAD-dependent oxidoreductase [Anaerolineales bacterium]MCB0250293.1 NAD(P)/FAD-dependent oxidoreductase [Anaerolineae bacterium]MCB9141297.1 NAD(P)/FAD-dependent oxidoreductase [Anaerolineales bacterium]MCO5243317.1 NAD(P)/FAD-dependent oxidoreductase [Anaerolineae bacterium]